MAFERCCHENEISIDEFLSEFDQRHYKLKECGVVLPDAVLTCRLLKSCNLSDVHFQLALSTTSSMTFENMGKTLKRLFADGGIACLPKNNGVSGELSQNFKVEPVLLSEGYQHRSGYRQPIGTRRPAAGGQGGYSNSGRGYQRGGRRNPVGLNGRISKCHVCGSEMHWARSCPHANVRNTLYSGDIGNNNVDQDRGEEVQITLMAYESRLNDKINILFGE